MAEISKKFPGDDCWSGAVPEDLLGRRLDLVLVQLLARDSEERAISRSKVERLIDDGRVFIDGKAAKSRSARLERPALLTVYLPPAISGNLTPDAAIRFEMIYDDPDVCVVNKPAGLIVHPGSGVQEGTLVHGLLARFGDSFSAVGHPKRPGIVQRLDKDTSGLMVVAKTEASYQNLIRQFQPPRKVHRTYLALTRKPPKTQSFPAEGVIDLPVGRDEKNRTRMSAAGGGQSKEAITRYRIKEELHSALLLELELETGRTHQIRIHLESRGVPIIGDKTYQRGMVPLAPAPAAAVKSLGRQALHAWRLRFEHPRSGSELSFEGPLPAELAHCLQIFREEK